MYYVGASSSRRAPPQSSGTPRSCAFWMWAKASSVIRSDIWSVWVVLYEAITGDVPFGGSNYKALLRAIVEDEPKSIIEQASGDPQLWEIMKKGLAKDRLDRYRSMAELGRALAEWLLSRGVSEGACGTSVESKWLGHVGDAQPLNEVSLAGPRPSGRFQPNLTLQGPVGALEADSGSPVAAPRWPKLNGRAYTTRALLVGCALAGALAFAVGREGKSRAALRRSGLPRSPSSFLRAPITCCSRCAATPMRHAASPSKRPHRWTSPWG
jgi:hypothetical protein